MLLEMKEKGSLLLWIGAGKESVFGIKEAQKAGYYVIAFDGNENAEGLKYADEKYVEDIKQTKSIINKLADRKPEVVIPVPIGRYLTTTGIINDYYHLKGCSKLSCNLCTDKYLFHIKTSKNKLRDAICNLIPAGISPRGGGI